jgi:purine-binding chemotaxis protein CheW
MIDLRGRVLPAIDLRVLLGLDESDFDLQTPMIVARTGEHLVALVVDEVDDVVDVADGCVQDPSGMYEIADRLLGVCRLGDGLVFILDVEALIPEAEVSAASSIFGGERS